MARVRVVPFLAALLLCCSPSSAATRPTDHPTAAAVSGCHPTTSVDASGVITSDGATGIVGETSTDPGQAPNGTFKIVRRGAHVGDVIQAGFEQIGTSAPATSVWYGISASTFDDRWGAGVFVAGWKPIGFVGSCWRLLVNGSDTGIVLEVRQR